MKRVLVIGTGPSGFAVLSSLDNLDDVWVMDGQSEFDNSPISIRDQLGLKLKFGSSHTYVNARSLGIVDDPGLALPISYSRGGFGEIWGNGFTPYDVTELMPSANLKFQIKVRNSMKQLLDILEFSHAPSEIDERFGKLDKWSNSGTVGKLDTHPFFRNILNKRKVADGDQLLFGQPNLLLDSSKCKKCGLCLTGCPYGALFDPGEHINRMVFSRKLDSQKIIKGIVSYIKPSDSGATVFYSVDGRVMSQWFDEVILATGPLSTALILINSKLLPEEFEVPDSQVFYGAFLSKRRVRPQKEAQEVSQMVCYPRDTAAGDFQISLYAPSELSRERISQIIFPKFLKKLRIPKFLSERIIPVIGFLPQDVSGRILIKKDVGGIKIMRQKNLSSVNSVRSALKIASTSLRPYGLFNLPLTSQIPVPGSGFHIGGSLPLGSIHLDEDGFLAIAKSVRVLDASILPKIPAGAHTFLTMALIRALLKGDQ